VNRWKLRATVCEEISHATGRHERSIYYTTIVLYHSVLATQRWVMR